MVVVPKKIIGSSESKTSSAEVAGTLVQYDDTGDVVLGIVVGTKKERIVVLNERGRENEFQKNRLYVLPGKPVTVAASQSERKEQIKKLAEEFRAESEKIDIAEIWGLFKDDSREYSVEELSITYFGPDSAKNHGALRSALILERIHFKRDRDSFEPRTEEVVEDLKRKQSVAKEKEELRKTTCDLIRKRVDDNSVEVPQKLQDQFQILAELAAGVQDTDTSRQKEGRELLQLCLDTLGPAKLPQLDLNGPPEKQAFSVLSAIGYFDIRTNLSLIRFRILTDYSEEVLQVANSFVMPEQLSDFSDEDKNSRRDLTVCNSFTIDDFTTKDMDDALSLDQTIDGYDLGIHITDLSWGIKAGSVLDSAAAIRATSLYCADRTINMLPESISEGTFSLKEGAVRPCLSCLVSFNSKFEIVTWKIAQTFIKSRRKYSYDEVDDLLENEDQTFITLHQIATMCEETRIRQGAMRVQKREVIPRVDSDGKVVLQEILEDAPSRALVAEMMVLANSLFAEFAANNKIPVLYRGQEKPIADSASGEPFAPEGPAKDFAVRTKLKKSTSDVYPQFHAGLGLTAYIQATSPIRRYIDLCHQRQFDSFFKTGKPWKEVDQFRETAFAVEDSLQRAMLASRETKKFWLLKYLEQRDNTAPIIGTIVRTDLKLPLVELDEVYFTTLVKFRKPVELGEKLNLKVIGVEPHWDYLRLELM